MKNLSEIEPLGREKGSRFGFSAKRLAAEAGAKGIGCTWYEQQPGRTAFPHHFHCNNEEGLFVLEGRGTVYIGEDKVDVGPGDYVALPVGPEHAHHVENTGDEPLRYLCLSTQHPVEVVGYPDSGKVGALAMAPTASWPDPGWVRGFFKQDSQVDYYEGEETE